MRAISFSRLPRLKTYFLLFWAIAALVTGVGCFASAMPATLTQMLKTRLAEHLIPGSTPPLIRETPIELTYVRTIVRDNLNGSLLTSVRGSSGTDSRFVPTGSESEAQIALLILEYADREIASRMAARLSSRKGYFKNTKILTRFSYATAGNQLAIVFTENAGNEAIVKFIDKIAETFRAER
jgi:hypothetical protein